MSQSFFQQDDTSNTSIVSKRSPRLRNSHPQLAKYRFGECIGRGNFGDVYKALNTNTDRAVAIKAINLEHSEDDIPILLQEINLLRSLRHDNITNWFETIMVDVTMYIVMEYCSEGSCADLLRLNRNGLPEPSVAYILKNVLQGLEYLHSLKIIHRDIKAANILITKDCVIKLADFGVSGEMMGKSGRKTFVGTPYWMAPEIIAEKRFLKEDQELLEQRLIDCGIGKKTLYKLWKRKIFNNQFSTPKSRPLNTKDKGTKVTEASFKDTLKKGLGFLRSHDTEFLYQQAPEEEDADDDVEYDEKVDIWALGITMIELSTGKVPNSEKEPLKALFEIPKKEPPRLPLSSSYHMREFSLACLCKDPTLRASAKELKRFRFVAKCRLKSSSPELRDLTGHGSKLKKRKPKFEISFDSVNYGPAVDWDLKTSFVTSCGSVAPLKGTENNSPSSESYAIEPSDIGIEVNYEVRSRSISSRESVESTDSLMKNENTLANSFFDNHRPLCQPTANTSPFLQHHRGSEQDLEHYQQVPHIVSTSEIRNLVEVFTKQLYQLPLSKNAKQQSDELLHSIEEGLVAARRSDTPSKMAEQLYGVLAALSGVIRQTRFTDGSGTGFAV